MSKLRLPIGSYGRASSSRLFNCYAEATIDGKAPIALIGAPGVPTVGTLPETPYRGSAMYNGLLYAVAGNGLYSIGEGGGVGLIGVIDGYNRVSMAANRDALVIGTNSTDYIYNGTLTAITDADFQAASQVDVLDSFAVWIKTDSDQIFCSGLADSGDYDALDFATAEAKPDKLVSHIVDHNQWILFGEDTTEIWWNAGNAGFPFERIANGIIEHGCAAADSVAKADSGVFWLDDDHIVRRLVNIQALRVSNHAIEELIRKQPDISEAVGFTFSSDGHIFYCLTFAGLTVVYDAATNEWHERKSTTYDRWRVADATKAYGGYMAFDAESGQFGLISADSGSEFGEEIRASWRYPTVYAEGRIARHSRLEIMLNVGESAINTDYVMGLRVSDDGGKTFDELPTRTIGQVGEYFEAPIWTKLGSSRNRVYEPWIADNVRRVIIDTQLEVQGGRL